MYYALIPNYLSAKKNIAADIFSEVLLLTMIYAKTYHPPAPASPDPSFPIAIGIRRGNLG